MNFPISFLKEGKTYIAYSPALDLSSCGKTLAESERMFTEAVTLFIEELQEMGTLNETLSNLGWTKVRREWHSPVPIAHRMKKMKLPA